MAPKHNRLVLLTMAMLLATAGTFSRANACGYCATPSIGAAFALPHPKAIEIAVATRKAIEQGILHERGATCRSGMPQTSAGWIVLEKVTAYELLKNATDRLRPQNVRSMHVTLHFVFVDSNERCDLLIRDGLVQLCRGNALCSEVRIVTTKPTMDAVLQGRLSLAAAQMDGLILVETNNAGARSSVWKFFEVWITNFQSVYPSKTRATLPPSPETWLPQSAYP